MLRSTSEQDLLLEINAHACIFDRLRGVPRHLLDRGHAGRVFRRNQDAEISRFRIGSGARPGAARHYPEGSGRGDLPALPRRGDRFRQTEKPDRTHRLSSAAGRAAACRSVPRWAWRMVPLGRHHPGHHRYCDGDADSPGARPDRAASRWDYRSARRTRAQIPRYADGRPQQPAAGGADHLRLQNGDAAGTLSSLGGRGLATQAELMKELQLGVPAIAWHTVRDCIAEVGCFLGLVTGSCGKIALDVKLLMQTEVEEVYEPFHEGRGSSSTMPQKRNPISSVYITALVSIVRQQVAALLDAMVEDHERATGPWEIEWIVIPEIFCLTAGALAHTEFVLKGLQVDEKKMRANLDLTKGLIVSEAVMMGLGPYLGRQYAHDLVYEICRQVVATGRPLVELLAENAEIAKHLDRRALEKLCDPANYLGEAGAMVDRVLATTRI